jgi:quercetin dioxygenase-like cupin family protein
MNKMMCLAAGLVAIGAAAAAQQPGFTRTILQQTDLSVPGREAVTAVAEFQTGATAPRHTHPGEEISYVIEGSLQVEIAGKPPVTVPAGKTFVIPAGTVHGSKNVASGITRVVATYIVEKGKPLSTPAQ